MSSINQFSLPSAHVHSGPFIAINSSILQSFRQSISLVIFDMSIIPINPGEIIALGAIWPPVCAIVLGLRIYSRRHQNVKLGLDDWLIIPAFVCISKLWLSNIVLQVQVNEVGI